MKFKKKTSQQVNGTQMLTPPPNKTDSTRAATDRGKHVAVNPEARIAILELDSRSSLKPGPAAYGQALCLSLALTWRGKKATERTDTDPFRRKKFILKHSSSITK